MESKIQMRIKLTNIKKHVACNLWLYISVNDKFSKPFKSYLEEHAIYSIFEKSKYRSNGMKKKI